MASSASSSSRAPVRFGMVGGGAGSWIGQVHRIAAQLDLRAQLVAGVFSSNAQRSLDFAQSQGLDSVRLYDDFASMAQHEAALDDAARVQFVVIATHNDTHFAVASAFLDAGVHVVLDKPLTDSLETARALAKQAEASGLLFMLTHCYSGYPMIKHARFMVQSGELGALRKVMVEYPQGWVVPDAPGGSSMSKSSGVSSLIDVGTHAEHLLRYVTGLKVAELVADVSRFVPDSSARVPNDYNILTRFDGGVRGVMVASQVMTGEGNPLRLRVYGDDASLEWVQDKPEQLIVRRRDRPVETMFRGDAYLSEAAKRNTRLPGGHPEGYLEAFANLYATFIGAVRKRAAGEELSAADLDFPSARDGLVGLQFVAGVQASAEQGAWVKCEYDD